MGRNLLTFSWLLMFISQLLRVDATIDYINVTCVQESGCFKKGNMYGQNLDILLSDLPTQSSTRPFYNSTAGNVPDEVYAMYQCRGDVTKDVCNECIQDAVEKIVQGCPLHVCWLKLGWVTCSRARFTHYPIKKIHTHTTNKYFITHKKYKSSTRRNYFLFLENIVLLIALGFGDVDFVEYDLATLKAATNDFSINTKLGQGGFGTVYLGTLTSGQQVAIKRLLASNSTQGTKDFMAEAQIVAKLQHRCLVKLLGSCSNENEKLLVFEFLPNNSLDHFLFDPTKRSILVWEVRHNIIIEVAKGIQYLHVDSRIKIIHRDLKASNILLDMDMKPKISDFGMARLFERGQMLGNTNQIIGTRGYMAPEYWRGEYSEKSDVYSFGIIILELVSGQNNRVLSLSSPRDDLPSQAWRLWDMDQSLQLMDRTLYNNYSMDEVIRCIHIGLLCVQENAVNRPTMVHVVHMLTTSTSLPPPTAPTSSPNHFNIHTSSSDEGGQSDQFAFQYASPTNTEMDLYPR